MKKIRRRKNREELKGNSYELKTEERKEIAEQYDKTTQYVKWSAMLAIKSEFH